MKCPKCSAEWHLPNQSAAPIKLCPFCGASLQIEADQSLATLDSVLTEIIARFGIDILRDGSRTVAVFSDLAPKLKKERLLLTYLMQFDGNVKLLEVQKLDKTKQHATYLRVVQHLVDEQFVAQQAAENVCLGFLKAIGIVIEVPAPVQEVIKNIPAQQVKTPAPTPPTKPQQTTYKTPPKSTPPVTPKTQTPKVSSYNEYMKLLEEYFLQSGKVRLTREQVQSFIYTYALNVDWKITYAEVEKDLATIYSKYSVPEFMRTYDLENRLGVTPAKIKEDLMTIAQQSPKPSAPPSLQRKNILTYNDYLKALEQRFIENNKRMLSRAQIVSFLDEYNLSKSFNVQIHEVETDLREIQKKCITTR